MSATAKANKIVTALQKGIDSAFQLERMEDLTHGNLFGKLIYMQLVCHINYCMLHQPIPEEEEVPVIPTDEFIAVGGQRYPLTLNGRKAAIAESFRHAANKIDDWLSTTNIANILSMMDLMGDIALAALRGQRTTQRVTIPKD